MRFGGQCWYMTKIIIINAKLLFCEERVLNAIFKYPWQLHGNTMHIVCDNIVIQIVVLLFLWKTRHF